MTRVDPCALFKTELPKIAKPARYLGGESGSVAKPGAPFRMALCFPDLYEIGMANNAMRILYAGLNALEGVACERVFAVAADYERLLRDSGTPLYGLETGAPVSSFDVLGFTVGYELAATNVLSVLDLSGVPLRSADRGDDHPIVIAGGPAITNPTPYSAILDAVWIGEAEGAFFGLVAELAELKRRGASRGELLARLREESAFWMPAASGRPAKKAVRAVYDGFAEAPYRYSFPVPVVKPVQDHGVVEIMRGCPNGCRFCHAGYFYRPRRLRAPERVLEEVEAQVLQAGHREISLSSLSSGDYPGIVPLVALLNERWSGYGVSFQLPSLKVESFPLELIEDLSGTRKSGLTFAVETPLEQWQMTLNKRAGLEKIGRILAEAERRGYRVAKFYFMIGLPLPDAGVSEEAAIVSFIGELLAVAPSIKLNLTVATFVPKPHTPFQWSPQLGYEEAASRIYAVKDAFKGNPRVKVTYHTPFLSWLEGVVSRGDESTGELIIDAYSRGARFDAWDDLCDKGAWKAALEAAGDSATAHLAGLDEGAELPWSGVSLRVSRRFLLQELERSRNSALTAACADGCSDRCGSCDSSHCVEGDDDILERIAALSKAARLDAPDSPGSSGRPLASRHAPAQGDRHRLLFRYAKEGRAAFFAHHELQAMLSSAIDRAGAPIAYSEGFNPMPRLEISEPMSLGFESADEYGSVILTGPLPADPVEIASAANRLLHGDLRILEARSLLCPDGRKFPSLSSVHWGSRYRVDLLETGLDPRLLVATVLKFIQSEPLLAEASVEADGTVVTLLLPFAGKRELGLPAIFEGAYGFSIREARISVRRVAQYAKATDGSVVPYGERYAEYRA